MLEFPKSTFFLNVLGEYRIVIDLSLVQCPGLKCPQAFCNLNLGY